MGILSKIGGKLVFYCKRERARHFLRFSHFQPPEETTLRDDYLKEAQKKITDPMILVNVVSRRAKQLKSGYKPLIESLERLSAEDMALREIMEGKITYQLAEPEEETIA
jgi:DNA-directed RNA polymerase subunit omega